ncbi:hypothetical protein KC19_6G182800 [Ceratodon purpureus]|uniref:BTB domain-containing protein n=1 Tax=Ceratodon purpureus TaxID=3225 RepID=A0A8T0HIQ1_CERPU|nr:hypothetical protein KC19_6G182800 [Ceratodon purpureus]
MEKARFKWDDVTIILTRPTSTMDHDQGDVARKRRRLSDQEPDRVQIRAESSKLRECSRYFEACMSERWMSEQMQGEFYLVAHTEVRFYRECFTRMYSPCAEIVSVDDCIQLLKVASQIQYDEVMDIGVRYLASVPWSEEEEEQVRSFYASGQLYTTESTSDLCRRLQVDSNGEERQRKLLGLLYSMLSRSLEGASSNTLKSRRKSQEVFTVAFNAVVGASGPGKIRKLQPAALDLVTGDLKNTLNSIKNGCQEEAMLLQQTGKVCWLFSTLRGARSAQKLVEIVLRDGDIAPLLQSKFQCLVGRRKTIERSWAKMIICTIFQDVLSGQLFLKTAERLALFRRWNWILTADNFKPETPLSSTLLFRFIMGLPYAEQEEIFRSWLSSQDDPAHQADYDLSDVHSMWVKHLISQAEKRTDTHLLLDPF